MTIVNLCLIIICVLVIVAGQILFKLASARVPTSLELELWMKFAFDKYLLSAFFLYACSSLLWVFTLKRVELSLAYPFMALAFILVPISCSFFLGEDLNARIFLGAGLIAIGVVISVT
jgi:drug/metabolite transporter (DMT)-like permease